MAISLTPAAAERVRTFIASRGKGLGLRLGVRKTGCSGFAYVVNYADDTQAQDLVFEDQGVKVFVDPESLPLINGTTVDFVKQGLNEAFRFHNPNIKGECGCGESPSTSRPGATRHVGKRRRSGAVRLREDLNFSGLLAKRGPARYNRAPLRPPQGIIRMALERTLSIVKPDGVARNLIGQVIGRFEKAGLKVVAARMVHLSQREAEGFYAVHAARPFFKDLVKYMTSGPVLVQVLEGENAIAKNREIMGATDPKKAAPGTIRADLAESIEANTVHGSDSAENAAIEIAYFFRTTELCPRG